jgi:hypothetical protein
MNTINIKNSLARFAATTAGAAVLLTGAFVAANAEDISLGAAKASAFNVPTPVQSSATSAQSKSVKLQTEAPVYFDFNAAAVPNYDAVVVTICGLSFEELEKVMAARLFSDSASQTKALAQLQSKSQPPSGAADLAAAAPADTYLEDAFTGMAARANKKFMIVPLRWTRNPDKTAQAEANFMVWLPKVAAAAAANHKPLYIFAHSWGTVLTHDVLMALAAQGSPVHVDKLITMGSPIVPSNAIVKEFENIEKPNDNFASQAVKPANVGTWINFWATRDMFSNTLSYADRNYQVDAAANPVEQLITIALLDPLLYVAATVDAFTIDSLSAWHSSYFNGYYHAFKSVGQALDLDIPDKTVMPNSF